MKRIKPMLLLSFLAVIGVAGIRLAVHAEKPKASEEGDEKIEKIVKTDKEWKEQLSEMEYYVTRKAGTERPGTGKLLKNKKVGIYTCVSCAFPLFKSNTKFDSGTGWPSFYAPINKKNVGEKTDRKLFYERVEVLCNRCDAHLGHVFPDGPKPTGLRYCINSVALGFVEGKEAIKKLSDK